MISHDSVGAWEKVKEEIGNSSIKLGRYTAYQMLHTPRRLLFSMSYHKFAAKLIGNGKRIFEAGCGDGVASTVLWEFAKSYLGVDVDGDAIDSANDNFAASERQFRVADILSEVSFLDATRSYDAVVSFDVIEHIPADLEGAFFATLEGVLGSEGMCIVGTPSLESNRFASKLSRDAHINLYDAGRLAQVMGRWFRNVMIYSANDEVVHTGFSPLAHYFIGVGYGRR